LIDATSKRKERSLERGWKEDRYQSLENGFSIPRREVENCNEGR